MLLEAKNLTKQVGAKYLFEDVSFSVSPGEKIALIGRNGQGKTTLLKIINGDDHDFLGEINTARGTHITLTKQEHIGHDAQTPLEYVIASVPQYTTYKNILEEYEAGKHTNLTRYLEVLDIFTDKKLFNLPEAITSALADFGIPPHLSQQQPLAHLSGGQKRYVEMTRMMFSQADIMLVDEPTNHLDYLGKERFISWMKSLKKAVIVVTHDRDVLKAVDKIIELKDKRLHIFNGNFDQYIQQNSSQTMTSVKQYQVQLNRLVEAKKKVDWGLRMRAKSKAWKIRYDHWQRDYDRIKAATIKPSFWIDQESVESLDKKTLESYDKFKEKNISISISSKRERGIERLEVRNLALGYDDPIFAGLQFTLHDNDRVFIKGKNGAGKSTLVRSLLSLSKNVPPAATVFEGEIRLSDDLRIGEYQQELDPTYLSLSLSDAIRKCYFDKGIQVTEQTIKQLLAQYLFDPIIDAHQKIRDLSGGQKARFQIITMLLDDPNLLILDEPTNHLDLPSIEELENALVEYQGAILYISHDTYFIKKLGGRVVELE